MTDCRKPDEPPAAQPKPPGSNCDCPPWSWPEEPKLPDPLPDTKSGDCKCPKPPTTTSTCLEALIDEQNAQMIEAEKAKGFKDELQTLLKDAKIASGKYGSDAYTTLLKQWKENDRAIVTLLDNLVCQVKCWRCVIECYVCPLLTAIRDAEHRLYGKGDLCATFDTIYDRQYWRERDLARKTAIREQVRLVLDAWKDPYTSIKGVLDEVKSAISQIEGSLAKDGAKVVVELFFRVIPRHLAVAPPAETGTVTSIPKKFTEFCEFDEPAADDCCGPDVGKLSLRRRIAGRLPYLVAPSDYFTIICCLVKNRYRPAKDAVAKAEAALQATKEEITRLKTIVDGLKDFESNAKAAIPGGIRCCGDQLPEDKPTETQTQAR